MLKPFTKGQTTSYKPQTGKLKPFVPSVKPFIPSVRQTQIQQPALPTIQQPQHQGINWGGVGSGALDLLKGIVKAPFTIPLKATASLLEPISGVSHVQIPFMKGVNTYQQDTRQNISNAQQQGKNPYAAAAGSALQPLVDIGSLAYGGPAGKEAMTGGRALLQSLGTGGAMGAGFGLVGGLQQGGNAREVAQETLKNALLGAGTAGVLHGVLSGAGKLIGSKEMPLEPQGTKTETPSIKLQPFVKGQGEKPAVVSKSSYKPSTTQVPENVKSQPLQEGVNPLIQEARKYKSAEEFVKAQNLYHGTNAKLEGDALSFGKGAGAKKGGQSGGHFLSDDPEISKVFGENVYHADPAIKKQVIDLTDKNGIKKFEDYIGKTYKTFEGDSVEFTRYDFEAMFPSGKADFASISQYPELVEQIVKENKLKGVAFNEYAGGKIGKTYQILDGDIPVKTKSQLTDIWNKSQPLQEGMVNKNQISSAGRIKTAEIDNVYAKIPNGTTTPDGLIKKVGDKLYPTEKVTPKMLKNSGIGLNADGSIKEGFNINRINFTESVALPKSSPLQEGGGVPPISKPPVAPTNETPQGDPIVKITEILKQAKPLNKEQAALYSAERAKRVARMVGAGQNIPGEQGYFAQLGQLKGSMPKVGFESIRNQISQPDIDHLFNTVEQHPLLTPFEKISAKTGLSKLLGAEGGQVPTKSELATLNEVFPKEFMQQVLEKRTTMQKLMEKGADVLNVPRSLMASFDLSAPLRQGIFLIGKPKQWVPAFKDMFKYAFSEKAYQNGLADIQARPSYKLMRENKLALTDMSKGLAGREEHFMSNLAEQIPGIGKIVRGSDRAYTGFLNKLRADTFDDLVNKLGKEQAPDIARFVNSATGRGELPQVLSSSHAILNGAFFSPRLMAARINMLNPQYYVSLSKPVRMEAIKSLLSFGGTVATVLGLAKLGGAEVGTDPRSADFGKIKIGNTRFDIMGGFQQYAVLAFRLATGEMVSSTTGKETVLGEGYKPTTRMDIVARFLQSKQSPIIGYAAGLFSGQDSMGQKFNPASQAIDRFIPMMAQDLSDLYGQYGTKGLAAAVPGVFGVGTQTYTDQIPVMAKTPTGNPTVQWNPYPSIGEKITNAITGTQLSNIPQDQWKPLADERLKEQLRQIDLDKAKTRVMNTGQPEYIGDTLIFLDNGIVKTKQIKVQSKTPLKKELLKSFYTK